MTKQAENLALIIAYSLEYLNVAPYTSQPRKMQKQTHQDFAQYDLAVKELVKPNNLNTYMTT